MFSLLAFLLFALPPNSRPASQPASQPVSRPADRQLTDEQKKQLAARIYESNHQQNHNRNLAKLRGELERARDQHVGVKTGRLASTRKKNDPTRQWIDRRMDDEIRLQRLDAVTGRLAAYLDYAQWSKAEIELKYLYLLDERLATVCAAALSRCKSNEEKIDQTVKAIDAADWATANAILSKIEDQLPAALNSQLIADDLTVWTRTVNHHFSVAMRCPRCQKTTRLPNSPPIIRCRSCGRPLRGSVIGDNR